MYTCSACVILLVVLCAVAVSALFTGNTGNSDPAFPVKVADEWVTFIEPRSVKTNSEKTLRIPAPLPVLPAGMTVMAAYAYLNRNAELLFFVAKKGNGIKTKSIQEQTRKYAYRRLDKETESRPTNYSSFDEAREKFCAKFASDCVAEGISVEASSYVIAPVMINVSNSSGATPLVSPWLCLVSNNLTKCLTLKILTRKARQLEVVLKTYTEREGAQQEDRKEHCTVVHELPTGLKAMAIYLYRNDIVTILWTSWGANNNSETSDLPADYILSKFDKALEAKESVALREKGLTEIDKSVARNFDPGNILREAAVKTSSLVWISDKEKITLCLVAVYGV